MNKKFTSKDMARAVMDSVMIREESFNEEKFQKEDAEAIARSKTFNREGYYGIHFGVDAAQYYEKNMVQSIQEACKKNNIPPEMERFIDLAFHWWNDVIDWAKETLKKGE